MADNVLFIDVETIPDQTPGAYERILAELKPPGSFKKAETIATWWKTQAKETAQKAYQDTGLNPTYGELISISWAFNEKPVDGYIRTLDEPESKILNIFYETMEEANTEYLIWVAHPIKFDLPFLLKRSIINNIRPCIGIPHDRSKSAFCTMEAWAEYREYISLDALCKALGIPGKDGMIGADVWPAVQAGEYEKVLTYNKSDVEMLRQVFRRIHFLDWLPSDEEKEIKTANKEDEKLQEAGFFDIQEKGKL